MQMLAIIGYGVAVVGAPLLVIFSRLAAKRRERELNETRAAYERLNESLVELTVRLEVAPAKAQPVAEQASADAGADLDRIRAAIKTFSWDYELYDRAPAVKPDAEGRLVQGSWFERYAPSEAEPAQDSPVRRDDDDWMAILRESTPAHWC